MRSMLIAVVVSSALAIIAETPHTPDPLTTSVTLMARVGQCSGGSFSPDGKTLAFLCDLSGVPQVWTAPTEGGWPTLVTTLDDPVNSVKWSPTSDWLALSVAPGGGMNTQIYLVHPDGTALKRYTPGEKITTAWPPGRTMAPH